MTDFTKAIGLVAGITQTAKRLADTREEVKVNEVAIQLQGVVLDLQTEMMMIQSDYQNVLRSHEDLEKKLVAQENWEKERARYRLERVGEGVFVYALNPGQAEGEPHHWLCTRCYDNKQKSILQRYGVGEYRCPVCKTSVYPTTTLK